MGSLIRGIGEAIGLVDEENPAAQAPPAPPPMPTAPMTLPRPVAPQAVPTPSAPSVGAAAVEQYKGAFAQPQGMSPDDMLLGLERDDEEKKSVY